MAFYPYVPKREAHTIRLFRNAQRAPGLARLSPEVRNGTPVTAARNKKILNNGLDSLRISSSVKQNIQSNLQCLPEYSIEVNAI